MLRFLSWMGLFFLILLILTDSSLVNTRLNESSLVFIAYEITGLSQDSVWVLHPETGKEWRVSKIASTSSPSWSPDGRWLVFSMWHEDSMATVKVNVRGTQHHWLTDIASDDYKWSPNGEWIAFTTIGRSLQQEYISQLYRIGANGDNQMILFEGGGNISQFEWSPDSTQIAFISDHETPLTISNQKQIPPIYSLYMMNDDGQSIYRITPFFNGVRSFSWSPDGKWIVFAASGNGTDELYKIRPDSSDLTKLTENEWREINPRWSPDGEKIIVGSDYSLHIMTPDGFIETDNNKYTAPSYALTDWMPNSQEFVFATPKYINKVTIDNSPNVKNISILKNLGWGGIGGLAVSPPIDYDWHPRKLLFGAGIGFLSLLGLEFWRWKQLKHLV